jgi:putative spermidine/putrescine transport system ATP-binding protein
MASAQSTFVEFLDVQKSYDGDSLVVKKLRLAVRRGEFLTMLGPSGSGKTTCLMMLAGFEAPTSGEIMLDGVPITRVPPYRRDIGMVFQNYALFPHLSVAENVAFPLEVRGLPKAAIAERVDRALAMVRLEGLGTRRPAQLSGGQQQRVALARALVFEPKLVLMDEPLGALDRQLRESMQYEIKRLHDTLGVTIVYVTHDQAEALTMSDRVAVFEAGTVQQLDSPQGLYERPQNAFVARFVGENNRLSGTVESAAEGLVRVRVGEALLLATRVACGGVGAPTTLSIRPERARLEPLPGETANTVEATVRELSFLGDHLRVRLALLGEEGFIVKLPNTGAVPTLAPGLRVRVGWQAEDCRALDPN